MKLRYTDPATEELEQSISYFRERAPSLVADFADGIDRAAAQILDNPHLARATEIAKIRRWYIRRFKYSIFYTKATRSSSCILVQPRGASFAVGRQ
jgi:plasmid stabilization system protein ParE